MEKYKLCPFCGKKNLPKMLECAQCETDLSNVGVMDEIMEKKSAGIAIIEDGVKMVRVCDCGAHNPVHIRKCENCGEDISDIVPEPEVISSEAEPHYILVSTDGNYAYEVHKARETIGREQGMKEYLCDKLYVSRSHADVYVEEGTLYIMNLSRTNYTYVNNKKIPDGPYELQDGDEIGLGGNVRNGIRQEEAAYFQVRIGSCI